MTAGLAAVLREEIDPAAGPDAQDTLDQARAVSRSLALGGWGTVEVVLGARTCVLADELRRLAPAVVFNLVESHCGLAGLAAVAPALCRKVGLPWTGSDEAALALAGDKALARRVMAAASVPVPAGTSLGELRRGRFPGPGRYIVKARFEDASLGLGPDCVVGVHDGAELLRTMEALAPRMGGDCVAERFIDGREFNLALLAGPDGKPSVLPLAEMVFAPGFSGPAILHHAAKWDAGDPDHAASTRRFDPVLGPALAAAMERLALACWDLFGLAGYGRIDMRLSREDEIFVIDVNPNPCIAPDAGFTAAAARAGLDHAEVVRRIVADARLRAGRTEQDDG